MDVQKEVMDCLWSEDLKRHIAQTGFRFSEENLLIIAYKFAPTFAERIRLLGLITESCPAVADHAQKCIDYQNKCLACFIEHSPDRIFELRIRDDPSDPQRYEDRFLCESYDAALEMIDKYYEEYDFAPEAPTVRYTITKRCILKKGEAFRPDHCGEAILGAGKVLISVEDIPGENELGPCPDNCMDCHLPCMCNQEAAFPNFLPRQSPVQYRLPDGSIHYGIDLSYMWEGPLSEFYVIPLDMDGMKNLNFETQWDSLWHEHIPVPNARAVSLADLPENLRDIYLAFAPWVEKNGLF